MYPNKKSKYYNIVTTKVDFVPLLPPFPLLPLLPQKKFHQIDGTFFYLKALRSSLQRPTSSLLPSSSG